MCSISYLITVNWYIVSQILKACPEMFDQIENDSSDDDDGIDDESSLSAVKFHKNEERGLSELVRQCLGKSLDKRQQMSDWERRPLRVKQVTYAGSFTLLHR